MQQNCIKIIKCIKSEGIEISMIRQYCQEDLPGIADLIECFATESGCFDVVGGFSRSHFLNTLESLKTWLRIWVRDSNKIITSALAMVEQTNPYSGEKGLEELFWFSRPEYRGNSENVKLLKAAEDYAKNHQVFYMAMVSMVEFHPPKIEIFYEKRGFKLHQKQYFRALINENIL